MRRALTRIGVAIALGAGSVAAIANVFSTSPIMPVDRSKFPQFDAIGLVERNREIKDLLKRHGSAERAGWGTALLVGPCSVLTNYHVPFGEDVILDPKVDYSLRLSVGYSGDQPFDRVEAVTPAVWGDLNRHDFAVLHDPGCAGVEHGWYERSPFSREDLVAMRPRVIVVWASGKAERGKLFMSVGNVIGIDPRNGNVLTDASSVPGSSGGAVFLIYNGRILLQGMVVGAASEHELQAEGASIDNANEFINFDRIYFRQDYRRYLKQDYQTHPQTNRLHSALEFPHAPPVKTCQKLEADKDYGLDEERVCA